MFPYHGMLESIVSDKNSKFNSRFWKRLMELIDVQLKMSTSRHPQTDGISEIGNRMVENYLRCYCNYLLPAAESANNSVIIKDLIMSPFEIGLG